MTVQDKRVKLICIQAVVEYTDGSQKTIDVNIEENEALFWSDRSVREILAPFYANPRTYLQEDLSAIGAEIGEQIQIITPDVVEKLWDTPVNGNEDGDRPILILKNRQCVPTVPCKKCPPEM